MNFLQAETKADKPAPEGIHVGIEKNGAIIHEYIIETQGGEVLKRDPFDTARLDDLLKAFHAEVDKMAQKAQSVSVTDDASCKLATLMENQAGQLYNVLEKTRKQEKAPFKEKVDYIDGNFGGLAKRVLLIKQFFNNPITQWLAKKKAEEAEKERLAKEEAAAIQRELDAKAEADRKQAAEEARKLAEAEGKSKAEQEAAGKQAAALVEDAPTVVTEMPAEVKIQTDAGSAKLKEKFVGELVDIRLVDDDCIQARWADLKKAVQPYINAQIAAGKRKVPGFKITKIAQLETRTSRVQNQKTYDRF